MGFDLKIFEDGTSVESLDAEYLEWLVEARAAEVQTHFGKMWEYYANPIMDLHPSTGSGQVFIRSGIRRVKTASAMFRRRSMGCPRG